MTFDRIIVGGGLQGALVALASLHRVPGARVAVVERDTRFGGNHTWCFHEASVRGASKPWVEPLVSVRWGAWAVRFPSASRTFSNGYSCVESAHLDRVLRTALDARDGCLAAMDVEAIAIGATSVALADGRTLHAPLVVDARGPSRPDVATAFQKFVGVELELDSPHALSAPLVIDATVAQRDGFRFFYLLPLAPKRVLVEETFFADGAEMDELASIERCVAYASERGLIVARIVRIERGTLSMPLERCFEPSVASPFVAGTRGGWFHPATGYSFPIAVRVAETLACARDGVAFDAAWARLARDHAVQSRFAVLLNRLLFQATPAVRRVDVLARFHGLSEDVVERFYGLETTSVDRLSILCGRPPRGVSIARALREMARA
jgi:lycopene beta-cyclase